MAIRALIHRKVWLRVLSHANMLVFFKKHAEQHSMVKHMDLHEVSQVLETMELLDVCWDVMSAMP